MRAVVFVSVVLFGCDSEPGPAAFDNDLPARMDCTSAGYFTPGGGHTAWRGTLDTTSGAFDFVAGPLHVDAPFPGEVDYPEIHLAGATAWDGSSGTLHVDSDTQDFALERLADVHGFVLEGSLDLGQEAPVDVWCWNPEIRSGFAYDADDGVCRDADGNEGTEPRPVQLVRETGDGQCADLRGVALDEEEYSYQTWTDFDLRGADLSGASLHFANIEGGSLEGAQMATFGFGYAEIHGTIDAFTTLPEAGGCETAYFPALTCFN